MDRISHLLKQIAEMADMASVYAGQLALPDASGSTAKQCVPVALPERLTASGIEIALATRSDNAPSIGELTALYGSSEPIDLNLIALHTSRFWEPNRTELTVSFVGDVEPRHSNRILCAMNSWSQAGGIQFVLTEGAGEVRISEGAGGHWSYTGTDICVVPQNEPTTNFERLEDIEDDQEFRSVVHHQAGHLLGFAHARFTPDQFRQLDTDRVYRYLNDRLGWSQRTFHQQLAPRNDLRSEDDAPRRKASVMNWRLSGTFSKHAAAIGWTNTVTDDDLARVGRIYPGVDAPA